MRDYEERRIRNLYAVDEILANLYVRLGNWTSIAENPSKEVIVKH